MGREDNIVAPRPWRVEIQDADCCGIFDADGEPVVVTDSGYYPPNVATAEFIVKCVNTHKGEE